MQLSLHTFEDVQVRTIRANQAILFAAKDVCRALGIKNHIQKIASIDQSYIVKREAQTNGGRQTALFVNEPGLYALIFKSRLAAAARFQKWVFEVVLPTIRKTGQFSTTQRMQLQDRETRLVELACTHFKQDDQMMILANQTLKTLLGGGTRSGSGTQLLPISVALDLSGEYKSSFVQKHRAAVGRMAAKLYRETFGASPKKTQQNVGGRLCAVNAYNQDELARILPVAHEFMKKKQWSPRRAIRGELSR